MGAEGSLGHGIGVKQRHVMVSKGQSRLSEAMAAEEGARARIAADIHDDTIQTLGAVALSLQNARDRADDEDAREALDAACRHVRDAADRLRLVMFELMPPLDCADLCAALDAYGSVLLAGSGMVCEIAGDAPEGLEPQMGAMAYRVIQEAMRNAVRHSGGTRVRVWLEHAPEELLISVSDDGIGMGNGGPEFPAHAGLQIIEQRVAAIGGTVAFDVGLHGRGTAVLVTIPVGGDGLP
jgi:two-component system NarL family sensor kinase